MIALNKEKKIAILHTAHTTMALGVADGRYFGQLYYGKRLPLDGEDAGQLLHLFRLREMPFVPSEKPGETNWFMNVFPFAYPTAGIADFHESCLDVRRANGQQGIELYFQLFGVGEKPELKGLPQSFGEDAQTLSVSLVSTDGAIAVTLYYSVFEDEDIIAQSAKIENCGSEAVHLKRAMSGSLHIDPSCTKILTLGGAWARERYSYWQDLKYGALVNESLRGESGHQTQPFVAACSENVSDDTGEVYAMNLIYSGNFLAKVQVDEQREVSAVMGIHPETFAWYLEPGEAFETPECVLTYSANGLGTMTRQFHDFFRGHLIRSKWKDVSRPILINNWEATYFDFDHDKLLSIAKEAAKAGIELLVVDDGWFGKRDAENSSLGDWTVNEEKMGGTMGGFADELAGLGLKLGLWFEPEMISPDSQLYRAHPEWVLRTSHRQPGQGRNQWVLDLANPEVVDYLCEVFEERIREGKLAYIKWDMNRALSDYGSAYLPPERQGETAHRYVLGLYRVQEFITSHFPDVLFENCSSGGARFDAGMLYYSPQIWCSDDMDPVERLAIVEGTVLLYPLSAIGAHISKDVNDITGRRTELADRAVMACLGTFGYELDITKLSEEERQLIPKQIARYRRVEPLVRWGDYFRLASYQENGRYDAVMVVAKDKSAAACFVFFVLFEPSVRSLRLRLKGLDADGAYRVKVDDGCDREKMSSDMGENSAGDGLDAVNIANGMDSGTSAVLGLMENEEVIFNGGVLMNAGLTIRRPFGDFKALLMELEKVG